MRCVAADVLPVGAKAAERVHGVIVKVVPVLLQAHTPDRLLVGLLVHNGGEHDADSHVPELPPQVPIS